MRADVTFIACEMVSGNTRTGFAPIRAVARACATNPVSVVVPCHRVVRKDGNLAGYRWGIDRKRMLLRREAAAEQTRRGKS